jgi:hypothetical protein
MGRRATRIIVMSSATSDTATNGAKPPEVRLDRLVGRRVLGLNNRPAGRLEEFRAELRGRGCVITEVVIGGGGLLERLGVGVKLLFGRPLGGRIARWDQLDLSNPERPRLTCSFDELREL